MPELLQTTLSSTEKVKPIFTAENIPEEAKVSGFAFSKRLKAETGLKSEQIAAALKTGQPFQHAALVRKLASDSDGGATIGDNSVRIHVADDHPNAASEADYILLYFGRHRVVRLNVGAGRFNAGWTYTWDLNDIADWLEDHVATDLWDEMALKTDSRDGIKIHSIRIIHSSQTILDWQCRQWLDGSRGEAWGWIVLTAKILEHKLGHVGATWIPQIHWAAREIGKTDGDKYGSNPGEAWCSEFASWCLRKALWDTPTGNIGSGSMERYFDGLDRKFTHAQLLAGDYRLTPGDYLRFEWANGDHHSGIFMEYVDDPAHPAENTTVRTIEGNASATAKVATRDYRDILSVGSCR